MHVHYLQVVTNVKKVNIVNHATESIFFFSAFVTINKLSVMTSAVSVVLGGPCPVCVDNSPVLQTAYVHADRQQTPVASIVIGKSQFCCITARNTLSKKSRIQKGG